MICLLCRVMPTSLMEPLTAFLTWTLCPPTLSTEWPLSPNAWQGVSKALPCGMAISPEIGLNKQTHSSSADVQPAFVRGKTAEGHSAGAFAHTAVSGHCALRVDQSQVIDLLL